jgi:hypothetical protein
VHELERGTWASLGSPLAAGSWWFPWQTPGKPALGVDAAGAALLMFDSVRGQDAFRWDAAAGAWARAGAQPTGLTPGYGAFESSITGTADGRIHALSTWTERVDANLGCYDDGARSAVFDGASWADLGEMKLDRSRSEVSACPYSTLRHAALSVDDAGVAWIATVEASLRDAQGHVHVFRSSADGWMREGDWPGPALAPRVSLAALAPGALWLSFTEPEGDGSRLVLHRRVGSDWQLFDVLHFPAPGVEGSLVCADAAGNPVVAVLDATGGQLLYRDR